ncbi:acetate/propionate family kinase [Lentibacter algarum]|uniref:acetate/propionate family kinase n=1 Tax=Lentibacter algarum TaxID=576131 RepID=UPI001C068ECA|nr:acetate/propionate family kinase [Lentibacter algarum]MBU2981263.1 acetate/propionate family kinase [Lentibacter algarum]
MFLALNTGSSSIKIAVFDAALDLVVEGNIAGVGTEGKLTLGEHKENVTTADHNEALDCLLDGLVERGITLDQISAAAHRVVHGGRRLTEPTRITDETLEQIAAMIPLAPLHNPAALAGMAAVSKHLPDIPQFASFDTAFHAGQPALATTYALPLAQREKGIRRYGFHGLSYAGMVRQLGDQLPSRLLALHLGAGVSLCAIKDGKSIATSMGYSPLSGPTMATRTGDIDGMAILRIAKEEGFEKAAHLLNKESGLLGLSGTTADMRTLLDDPSDEAQFAVDHFVYTVVHQAGGLAAALEGVDAIAFTGGIGENSAPIRERILARLAWLGDVPVHVVPADEERQIAIDASALMEKK